MSLGYEFNTHTQTHQSVRLHLGGRRHAKARHSALFPQDCVCVLNSYPKDMLAYYDYRTGTQRLTYSVGYR